MSQKKVDKRKHPAPTPFKSDAQKSYKRLRRKNGKMYTQARGIKQIPSDPYRGKVSFGTDRLRFEVLEVDPEGFRIHDELEPQIWKDEKLKPNIKDRLMEIAEDFIDNLSFKVNLKDVRFTGSLANYNWSQYSDIDLHLVVDFSEVDENKELVKELFDSKRMRWNELHDIKIKGYDVELYIEDEGEEHSSSGVYSIMDDEWIQHPEQIEKTVDLDTAKKKASDIEQQVNSINSMFDAGDFEKVIRHVDRLKNKIRSMRQAGLETEEMEFSPENIAFKLLRRNDLLDILTKLKYKAYDQTMTLDD